MMRALNAGHVSETVPSGQSLSRLVLVVLLQSLTLFLDAKALAAALCLQTTHHVGQVVADYFK